MARLSSWLTAKNAVMRKPETPELPDEMLQRRLRAMHQASRRRLSDRVETVFREACLSRDIESARHLLAALETMCGRKVTPQGFDRRDDPDYLPRMRDELRLAEDRIDARTNEAPVTQRRIPTMA